MTAQESGPVPAGSTAGWLNCYHADLSTMTAVGRRVTRQPLEAVNHLPAVKTDCQSSAASHQSSVISYQSPTASRRSGIAIQPPPAVQRRRSAYSLAREERAAIAEPALPLGAGGRSGVTASQPPVPAPRRRVVAPRDRQGQARLEWVS